MWTGANSDRAIQGRSRAGYPARGFKVHTTKGDSPESCLPPSAQPSGSSDGERKKRFGATWARLIETIDRLCPSLVSSDKDLGQCSPADSFLLMRCLLLLPTHPSFLPRLLPAATIFSARRSSSSNRPSTTRWSSTAQPTWLPPKHPRPRSRCLSFLMPEELQSAPRSTSITSLRTAAATICKQPKEREESMHPVHAGESLTKRDSWTGERCFCVATSSPVF